MRHITYASLTTHQRAASAILAFEHGIGHLEDLMSNSGTKRRTWECLANRRLVVIMDDGRVVDTGLTRLHRGGKVVA